MDKQSFFVEASYAIGKILPGDSVLIDPMAQPREGGVVFTDGGYLAPWPCEGVRVRGVAVRLERDL